MENSYRKLEGLNQSLLKKILVSPGAFIKQRDNQEDSEQSHFVFGSLVDDMLLSDIDIEDKYYILKDKSVYLIFYVYVKLMGKRLFLKKIIIKRLLVLQL